MQNGILVITPLKTLIKLQQKKKKKQAKNNVFSRQMSKIIFPFHIRIAQPLLYISTAQLIHYIRIWIIRRVYDTNLHFVRQNYYYRTRKLLIAAHKLKTFEWISAHIPVWWKLFATINSPPPPTHFKLHEHYANQSFQRKTAEGTFPSDVFKRVKINFFPPKNDTIWVQRTNFKRHFTQTVIFSLHLMYK